MLDEGRSGRCERAREKEKEKAEDLTDIERRPRGRKTERAKEWEGLTGKRKEEIAGEETRDRKVVTRGWLDQTSWREDHPKNYRLPRSS